MPEAIYPTLGLESEADSEVTEMHALSADMTRIELTTGDELQPLNESSNGNGVHSQRVHTTEAASHHQNGNGATGTEGRGALPRRKVKFLQKLMNFCGDPKRRQQTCSSKESRTFALCFGFSILGLMCNIALVHIMWFTNTYNDLIIPRLALTENSQSAEWWARPPYHTYLRVHIFNYTNIEEYQSGIDDKLKLQDLGPYTYIERNEKIDVKYYPNKTITYREKKSYRFDPSTSVGVQYDPVVVPNVPLLSAFNLKMKSNFFMALGIDGVLSIFDEPLFLRLPADSFLWGYESKFVDAVKLTKSLPFKHFGMFVLKNRTNEDVFRIESGEDDYDKIGVIESLNDNTVMEHWNSMKCNQIEGTDGSQFPPNDVQKSKTVTVFVKDMCRKVELEYEEDVSVFGDLPAKRYRSPMDSFAYPENNTEKQCYCTGGECPMDGIYDATVCTNDAPIYISFPHFYSGDQRLIDKFEGIKPIKELHATYADLHPRMGFPMDFASRFQLNVRIPEGTKTGVRRNIAEGEILPILWMEVVPAQFPPEVQDAIYHSSVTTNFVEVSLKYGSIAFTSGFLAFIIYLLVAMFFYKR